MKYRFDVTFEEIDAAIKSCQKKGDSTEYVSDLIKRFEQLQDDYFQLKSNVYFEVMRLRDDDE